MKHSWLYALICAAFFILLVQVLWSIVGIQTYGDYGYYISNSSASESIPSISILQDEHKAKVDEYLRYLNVTIHKPDTDEYVSYQTLLKDDVTLLIVSCQRFSVLSQSIESFEKYNTYPHISEKVILDDCSTDDEMLPMIHRYGMNTTYKYTFINNKVPKKPPYFGHMRRSVLNSEYLIEHYALNKTNFYFKTEDDFIFYKHGFIEDSFAIKYGAQYWYNKSLVDSDIIHPRKVLTANLQPLHYPKLYKDKLDVHDSCGVTSNENGTFPQYFTSPILGYNNRKVTYAIQKYWGLCWEAYTNRPTLQHIDDYLLIKHKYGNYTNLGKAYGSPCGTEQFLACAYKEMNYALAITLYNGYCAHGCSKCHVDNKKPQFNKHFSAINDSFVLDYGIFRKHCLPKMYYNYKVY